MVLDDFVNCPTARLCNLLEVHVVVLRLYTSAAFRSINGPLRDQERFQRKEPHMLPLTVTFLRDALGKLRAVASESADANNTVTLYRGMRDVKLDPAFLTRGGTELAPMSTTKDLKTAMIYGQSSHSVLLRVQTKSFMARGPDISWASCFPAEQEYLFPPLTYLNPLKHLTGNLTGEYVTEELQVGDAFYHVVDVEPTFSS